MAKRLKRTDKPDELPDERLVAFGARLAKAREAAKMTMQRLAAALRPATPGDGPPAHSQISRWENGENAPGLDTIYSLADALNTDPAALAFGGYAAQPINVRIEVDGGRLKVTEILPSPIPALPSAEVVGADRLAKAKAALAAGEAKAESKRPDPFKFMNGKPRVAATLRGAAAGPAVASDVSRVDERGTELLVELAGKADSMEPDIPRGSLLRMDRVAQNLKSQMEITDGAIYLVEFQVDDLHVQTVKRLTQHPAGVTAAADNPNSEWGTVRVLTRAKDHVVIKARLTEVVTEE